MTIKHGLVKENLD